jgi:hypothetical protein
MELNPSWEAANYSSTQEFRTLFGTRRFSTVITTAIHRSLSWARWGMRKYLEKVWVNTLFNNGLWPAAVFQGVKRQGRQADISPPHSAEVKNGAMLPLPPYVFMAWRLINYSPGITFTYVFDVILWASVQWTYWLLNFLGWIVNVYIALVFSSE